MPPAPPTIDQLVRDFRRALLALDIDLAQRLMRQYRVHRSRLAPMIRDLADLHRRAGELVQDERWLRDQEATQRLLAAAEQGMAEFAAYAARVIEERRQELIRLAAEHEEALTYASLVGNADVTPGTEQAIRAAFTAIPVEATTAIVGALQQGSPLRDLFDEFGPDASRRLGETLVRSTARGLGAEQVARELTDDLDGNAARALTIARTETHRAYRATHLERWRAKPKVYAGWTWNANLDGRTCPVCVAQHGTEHDLDEEFGSHPNCRCRPLPITRPLSEILGSDDPEVLELEARQAAARSSRETGAEWFDRQPEHVQMQIVGPLKHRAMKLGEIRLQDMIVETEHPRWGRGHRTGSLREARRNRRGPVTGGGPGSPPDIPDVPESRRDFGDEWREHWERAHRMMAPWERVPSMHLIDNHVWLHPEQRGWLGDRYDALASTTHMPGGVADKDHPERLVWWRLLARETPSGTMKQERVRVVLDEDGRTIITAVPE